MSTETERLRFPVGRFEPDADITPEKRRQWIQQIAALPAQMKEVAHSLPEARLDTPYRPGGWTVRQVIHHVADSHINAYIRFRLALTEASPPVKTYDQDKWAQLPDAAAGPVESSLKLLEGLHSRWATLLEGLPESDFSKTMQHPEWGDVSIDLLLQIYSWHGRHHLAHMQSA